MAYWDTLDESLTFQYMRDEDTSERSTDKRHVLNISVRKREPCLRMVLENVICAHFSQLLDHCCSIVLFANVKWGGGIT